MRLPSPAKLVVISAWGSRLSSAFVTIFSLRALSSGLSAADYATFIIIVGLSGWYTLVGDLGIGYATQNSVTRKRAANEDPGSDILSAYVLLAGATACVCIVTFAFSSHMSIVLFSNVANTLPETHASTLFWSGFVFTAAATAGASSKILYAAHKGYIANIANGIAAITGFLLLIGGLAHVEKKVLFSICALYGPSMIFSVALAAQQINSAWRTRSRPKFGDAIALLRAARWFLLFNTVAAAVLQIDYIIMSQKISELEIVQYYNVAKLFTFSAFFNQAIMMAIWPRFIEQYASGQFEKIQKSIQNLILSGVGLTFLTTVFVVLAAGFLSKLLAPGTSIEFRVTVIIGFGALALVRCLTDPYAIFMQSIGNMKPLIFFAAAQAPIGAILQWILSDYLGIEGILIALVTSFLLTVAWGLPYLSRLSLTKPKNDSAQRN